MDGVELCEHSVSKVGGGGGNFYYYIYKYE